MPKYPTWALVCLALVLPWLVASPPAMAQPASVTEELARIREAVDDLRAKTVQVPTLAAAVQELGEHVSELERRLAELERSQRSIPDAVARLDELEAQIQTLEHELASVRADLASVEQSRASAAADPGGGGVTYPSKFAWKTADGRYALGISGYLHARYQLRTDDDGVRDSTLRVRRARLGLDGHLGSPDLRFKLVLSAIRSTPLLDYYMDYQLHPAAILRVGQYKTQFTRAFITSSTRTPFLEEPLAVNFLRYDRDIQVGVHGTFLDGRVGYYAGVGNGAGLNRVDDNLDMAITARVDTVVLGERFKYGYGDLGRTPTPTLMLGAGAMHDLAPMPGDVGGIIVNTDVDGDGEADNARVISASADAVFRYQGIEAAVEAVFRTEDFGTILEHSDNDLLVAALGGPGDHTYLNISGQVTYLLPVDIRSYKLMLGARLGRSRVPFLGVGGRSSRLPVGDHVIEADGLVQLYNDRGHRFLGVDYSVHAYSAIIAADGTEIATTGQTEHRVIVETQLKF